MLEVYERLGELEQVTADALLPLTHDQREKGRLNAKATGDIETRLFLDRGKTLKVGEFLRSSCGKYVQITGATEPVVTAIAHDWQTFSRACYHLGNRHVKVQVGDCWLRMTRDHVLEDMLVLLGLSVHHEEAVFNPESGAYSGHGHQH